MTAQAASLAAGAAREAPPQGRIERWIASRVARQDTQQLTQRNVYILPTRAGGMLTLVLMVLLVASINFQLNLGYLLTFLLGGSVLAAMHVGHATLRGATLHLLPPAATFAGTAARLEVEIADSRGRLRPAIAVGVRGAGEPSWADVPGGGRTTLQLAWMPPGRGVHALPPIEAETRFPIGAFRAWTVWRPASTVMAYPEPEVPAPPLPPGAPREGDSSRAVLAAGAGEPDGVRAYRRGDPLRQVAWKKSAKAIGAGSGDLTSRDSAQPGQHDLWLDIQASGLSAPEARLSRLCAWVLLADRLDLAYGLRLPSLEIAPDTGAPHRQRCLEALARC